MRPIVPVCEDGQYFNAPVKRALEVEVASEAQEPRRKWRAAIRTTIIKRLLLLPLFGLPGSHFGTCTSIHNHRPERLIRRAANQMICRQKHKCRIFIPSKY